MQVETITTTTQTLLAWVLFGLLLAWMITFTVLALAPDIKNIIQRKLTRSARLSHTPKVRAKLTLQPIPQSLDSTPAESSSELETIPVI